MMQDKICIKGTFQFNDILFEATLRSGGTSYSLWIDNGRGSGGVIHRGWDYFGTTSWEVSALKDVPDTMSFHLYIKQGLRHGDDILTPRIHGITLLTNEQLLITEDFIGVLRDENNNVTFIDEPLSLVPRDNTPSQPQTEKKKKCISCGQRQPRSFYDGHYRSCRVCLANVTTKRVTRFPSRAVSIHK